MAHKKGVGSSENGRDSKSKRLGIKLFGGQLATAGNIILRQRGSKYHMGTNVYQGKDWTIHAKVDGTVAYSKGRRNRTFVSIIPFGEVEEKLDTKAKAAPVKKEAPKKEAPKKEAPVATAPVKEAAPVEKKATPKKEAPVAAALVKEAAPVEKKAAPKKAKAAGDDLKKIEGIGPKIASLLNDAGIVTFADLAAAEVDKLKAVLEEAGSRYKMHDPTTWPKQASFAADGKWDELKAWQDELNGGRE